MPAYSVGLIAVNEGGGKILQHAMHYFADKIKMVISISCRNGEICPCDLLFQWRSGEAV